MARYRVGNRYLSEEEYQAHLEGNLGCAVGGVAAIATWVGLAQGLTRLGWMNDGDALDLVCTAAALGAYALVFALRRTLPVVLWVAAGLGALWLGLAEEPFKFFSDPHRSASSQAGGMASAEGRERELPRATAKADLVETPRARVGRRQFQARVAGTAAQAPTEGASAATIPPVQDDRAEAPRPLEEEVPRPEVRQALSDLVDMLAPFSLDMDRSRARHVCSSSHGTWTDGGTNLCGLANGRRFALRFLDGRVFELVLSRAGLPPVLSPSEREELSRIARSLAATWAVSASVTHVRVTRRLSREASPDLP